MILHLPLDIEMREPVRRLAMALPANLADLEPPMARSLALAMVVRVWIEWGRAGHEWRPLDTPYLGEQHDWNAEPISHLLEEACAWAAKGNLIPFLCRHAVMVLQQNGEIWGLALSPDFWRENKHLAPDYVSQARKGGLAKAWAAEARKVEGMAKQQQQMLQTTLEIPEGVKRDADSDRKSVALIMRVYRACGMSVPSSSDYTLAMLDTAWKILEGFREDHIKLVEQYLYKNRDNVEVVKVPARVLQDFAEYYRRAE